MCASVTGARTFGRIVRALAAFACAAQALLVHAVAVGDLAPNVSLESTQGTLVLEATPKRWLYVDFWASWCAPCKQSFPWMGAMQSKFRSRGVQVVAINVDARRADADRFLKQFPADFAIAFDASGELPKRFAVKSMPSAYLIDPSGRVRLVHRGFRESDRETLEREIDAILSKG